MMRCLIACTAWVALAGCQNGEPEDLMLTFGSYASSPVVVTEIMVNGASMSHSKVVAEQSDIGTPRTGGYHALSYPPALDTGQIIVTATWVELFTTKAWTAQITAPVASLSDWTGPGSVRVGPVFGPNGLMILTSDPVPTSATDIPLVDVARVCGTRRAANDFDYTADPGELGITELLASDFPPVTDPECPAQE